MVKLPHKNICIFKLDLIFLFKITLNNQTVYYEKEETTTK